MIIERRTPLGRWGASTQHTARSDLGLSGSASGARMVFDDCALTLSREEFEAFRAFFMRRKSNDDGVSGQDRDSYSDEQDRDSYTVED